MFLDRTGCQYGQRGQQCGQQDHGQREAVNTEVVTGTDSRIPGRVDHELVALQTGVKPQPQDDCQREGNERRRESRVPQQVTPV